MIITIYYRVDENGYEALDTKDMKNVVCCILGRGLVVADIIMDTKILSHTFVVDTKTINECILESVVGIKTVLDTNRRRVYIEFYDRFLANNGSFVTRHHKCKEFIGRYKI